MMGFLDNYEGNKERTDRWINTYPEGRLEATIINFDAEKGSILVRAAAWRNQTEIEPAGIDFAYGYQAAYNANMKRWFVEDTVTSALMRVMALVMGNTEKATKETMYLVKQSNDEVAKDYDYWTTKHGDVPSHATAAEAEQSGIASLGSSLNNIHVKRIDDKPEAAPECRHGTMRWNQNKPDALKSWAGYFCTHKDKEGQCKPNWFVLTSDGTWKPQI
jgi:hypothetical protein